MITILTGAPGHGKSYTLVKIIDETLHKGLPVITNVPLVDDWAEVFVRRHMLFARWRHEARERKIAHYRRLVFISDDIGELVRVRVEGEGEGRARVIIDESQRKLNVRSYRDPAQKVLVDYISGHRHYGVDVILSTQHIDNLDSQVKKLYEYHSEVRNMRKLPFFGAFLRFNLFIRRTHWNDRRKTKARPPEMYTLSKSLARLYGTHALNDLDWPDDAIVMPLP
jgi:hypothetical protein